MPINRWLIAWLKVLFKSLFERIVDLIVIVIVLSFRHFDFISIILLRLQYYFLLLLVCLARYVNHLWWQFSWTSNRWTRVLGRSGFLSQSRLRLWRSLILLHSLSWSSCWLLLYWRVAECFLTRLAPFIHQLLLCLVDLLNLLLFNRFLNFLNHYKFFFLIFETWLVKVDSRGRDFYYFYWRCTLFIIKILLIRLTQLLWHWQVRITQINNSTDLLRKLLLSEATSIFL